MSADWIVREDHPFDRGYWARYDGRPLKGLRDETRDGWKTCDRELAEEADAAALSSTGASDA